MTPLRKSTAGPSSMMSCWEWDHEARLHCPAALFDAAVTSRRTAATIQAARRVALPGRYKRYATWIIFIVVLVACSIHTDATPYQLIVGLPEMGKLLGEMFPPDWSYLPTIWKPMLETIQIAIVGTTLGALLAIPVALLCAYNVMPRKLISLPMRTILNLVRTVPDLLFASIFVAVFGIGPFAGMLALLFFSFGIIAKLTFEAIEAIDPGPLEAMTAVGASRIQVIAFESYRRHCPILCPTCCTPLRSMYVRLLFWGWSARGYRPAARPFTRPVPV